ncbi:hypothetical protein INT43_008217 [Umbelopsis isabellina]|uniref:Uncharacterized protein n=1 Tax=Mortierella isabellina TaxID=91625 RepID=A0A8H7PDC1_MORIS|nr:hypothetical protein INT43_008217 [Umbelopsis isabellina]
MALVEYLASAKATTVNPDLSVTRVLPKIVNIQYSTLITIIMRSFEALIEKHVEKHVGTNFKPKTLRYLFTEFPNQPGSTRAPRSALAYAMSVLIPIAPLPIITTEAKN